MTATIIELGARALAKSQSGVDEWDSLDEAFQENLKDHVRAVLGAMREPSEAMEYDCHDVGGWDYDFRRVWLAGIDAALKS